jgi:hypothetical protein
MLDDSCTSWEKKYPLMFYFEGAKIKESAFFLKAPSNYLFKSANQLSRATISNSSETHISFARAQSCINFAESFLYFNIKIVG